MLFARDEIVTSHTKVRKTDASGRDITQRVPVINGILMTLVWVWFEGWTLEARFQPRSRWLFKNDNPNPAPVITITQIHNALKFGAKTEKKRKPRLTEEQRMYGDEMKRLHDCGFVLSQITEQFHKQFNLSFAEITKIQQGVGLIEMPRITHPVAQYDALPEDNHVPVEGYTFSKEITERSSAIKKLLATEVE